MNWRLSLRPTSAAAAAAPAAAAAAPVVARACSILFGDLTYAQIPEL